MYCIILLLWWCMYLTVGILWCSVMLSSLKLCYVVSRALLSSTNITTINSYNHRPFFIVICINDIYKKSAPIKRLMNRPYSLSQIHSVVIESGEVILGERSDPGLISICFKGCQDFNSWLGLSRPHVVHVYVV